MYYTMYIFMIYALIFIAGVLLLENVALKSIHVWEATIKNAAIWSLYYDMRKL